MPKRVKVQVKKYISTYERLAKYGNTTVALFEQVLELTVTKGCCSFTHYL